MTKDQLDFYLSRKNTFGYNTRNDDQRVGWILLSKRFTKPRFFELVSETEDPRGYWMQRRIEAQPYWIRMAEVSRAVFDSDDFPENEDYLLNVSYSFRTLDDVERFLKELGYDLAEIKWRADVDLL
jgi:hypothetical protein